MSHSNIISNISEWLHKGMKFGCHINYFKWLAKIKYARQRRTIIEGNNVVRQHRGARFFVAELRGFRWGLLINLRLPGRDTFMPNINMNIQEANITNYVNVQRPNITDWLTKEVCKYLTTVGFGPHIQRKSKAPELPSQIILVSTVHNLREHRIFFTRQPKLL